MLLFDDVVRTQLRARRETEPSFDYLNHSARPAVLAFREMAERWFQHFPDAGKADLRARFRSPIEIQHQGAFLELYIHELLARSGYALEVHPSVAGTDARPDFLARTDDRARFYVESTLAGVPSSEEQAAAARIAQVYDSLNAMDSPNFFLEVQVHGAPTTPPPSRGLRRELANWLGTLDPDAIGELCQAGRFGELPQLRWVHEGWEVEFRPLPKSAKFRGLPGIRPIGMVVPQAQWLNTHGDLKEAVEKKAKKYGNLGLPFIVAVNVLSLHCDNVDIMNGLFGQETIVVTEMADGTLKTREGAREPNGAWMGPQGPRNTLVSGVLVVANLCPWNMGVLTPELFHNPSALNPLETDKWQLPQCVPNLTAGRVHHRGGITAAELLQIPTPWPVPDPEDGITHEGK